MPYVTPPSIPEGATCRALLIPDSTDWLAIFGGALTELIYKYNWEQIDGVSVDDAIQTAVLVINGFYEGCVSSGCNQPGGYAVLRVNPEGHVEQLIDGAWVEPQGDNAFPAIPARTEPTPNERKCLAAANAANVLQLGYESLADSFSEGLTQAEAIINLIAVFAVLWFWFAPILNGLVLLMAGFLELVINAFEYVTADAWDATFTDLVRCILYECATDDGDVVTFELQCVLTKLSEQTIGGDWTEIRLRAAVQLTYLLYILGGADFLAQAGGTTAITSADCDDCTQPIICITFDDESAPYSFIEFPDVAGVGTLDSGFGDPLPSGKGYHAEDGMWQGVEYEFDTPTAVSAVSLYYYFNDNTTPDVLVRRCDFLDDTDTVVYSLSTVFGATQNAWTIWTLFGSVYSDPVKKVRVYLGVSTDAGFTGDCWIDNICIEPL